MPQEAHEAEDKEVVEKPGSWCFGDKERSHSSAQKDSEGFSGSRSHGSAQKDSEGLMVPEVGGMKAEELCLASQASGDAMALLFSGFF